MKKFMKFVSTVAAVSLVAAPLAVSADEKTFLLGGSGPLTGAAASYGTSVKQGAEIAIQEINDAGGAQVGEDTYKFELAFEDDEATEDKAVQAYNTLMDKGNQWFSGMYHQRLLYRSSSAEPAGRYPSDHPVRFRRGLYRAG